jgi:hypothetical protein
MSRGVLLLLGEGLKTSSSATSCIDDFPGHMLGLSALGRFTTCITSGAVAPHQAL